MSTLREQTDAQMDKTRGAKPELMRSIDELVAKARAFEQGGDAVAAGQPAPGFELPDARGGTVSLAGLLQKGPAVVIFYRGSWCPYCNLQLRAMQARLADLHALGAELVTISPETPDGSLTLTEQAELAFPVLSDQDAKVAAAYGVAWEVPATILDHMRKDRGLDLADVNGGNGSVLPIPATFVVRTDGAVAWQHVDVDYRTRAEPADVVAAVEAIAG